MESAAIRNVKTAMETGASMFNSLFGHLEHVMRKLYAGHEQFVRELRADSRRHEIAHHLALWSDAFLPVRKDVLHDDDVAFHAGDLGEGYYLPRPVGHPRELYHDVYRGGHLLPYRTLGQVHARHQHHGLEPRES